TLAAHRAVGGGRIAAGDFEAAAAGLERARALSQRGDFPVQHVSVLARLGYAQAFSGRLAEGLALLEEAARHVESIDGFWRPRFLGWLAEAYLAAGRLDEAVAVA